MKPKKSKQVYEQRRRDNLIEDNNREDAIIKKLNKKLGLARRKPRRAGGEVKPTWLRESGLDYFLDFEKHSTHVDSGKGNIIIGAKKTESKLRKNSDIYGQKRAQNDASLGSNSEEGAEDDISDSDAGDISMRSIDKEDDASEAEVGGTEFNQSNKSTEKVEFDKATVNILRNHVRRLLNCVSEAQMSRTISDLVKLFNDQPRALVRKVLIEEIDIFLGSFPLNRGQSVGWLQQELAACFVSTQGWLDQIGQCSRLVAHLTEFLVTKIPNLAFAPPETQIDGGILASRCVFIAYLYRFGAFTGDVVLDLIEELVKYGSLQTLQAAHQVVKPISSLLRKEHLPRCQEVINYIRGHIPSIEASDFEKLSELESISKCLSEKHSKEPALSSADHFVKMMRTWNKGISFAKEARLPLRLEELRCAGSRGRWWAVGSAFQGDALRAPLCGSHQRGPFSSNQLNLDEASTLSLEVLEVAKELGLITPLRQNLFSLLVSTSGGPDSTAEALIRACGFMDKGKKLGAKCGEHREREMIQIVVHCLVSEQPFNRFYVRVLGGLLNNHRRFGMMLRCAFWDVMAKDDLTVEAKRNAGTAIGMLAVVYNFPLLILKKYNFGDASEANVAFLNSIVLELMTSSFDKTLEKCAQLAGMSPRLGRNLRIFMRRMSKSSEDPAHRSFLAHLVSELRDLFP